MFLNLTDHSHTQLTITSAWQDSCDVNGEDIELNYNETQNLLVVNAMATPPASSSKIAISIPEIFNLFIHGSNLDLKLQNKILGDLEIECQEGNIEIEKMKGTRLQLNCGQANVTVKKVLEGTNATIRGKNLKAKMLNAKELSINCSETADIEAIYSESTEVQVKAVNIGLCRGVIKVKGTKDVTVNSIDGSFEISSSEGNVSVQVNSLELSSKSSVEAPNGSVSGLIDPEINATVTCNILKSSKEEQRLVIRSDAFHGFIKSQRNAVGYFSGESEATKRPNLQSKSGSNSGKIDTKSAESQALQKKSQPGSGSGSEVSPDLIISAGDRIRLETLSWIGRIQQKYGVKSS